MPEWILPTSITFLGVCVLISAERVIARMKKNTDALRQYRVEVERIYDALMERH